LPFLKIKSKEMSIAIWIISGVLALMFGMAGVMKSSQPLDKLLKSGVSWADRFPVSTIRLVGVSELLGAVGLILPWALHIFPILTPVAASGLALIMLLAIFHHLKHREFKAILFNLTLMALAVFVAYSRFNAL
jgi:hypothetical protein